VLRRNSDNNRESSLDHAFAKVCSIFGFEKLNKHQEEAIQQIVEMKRDVYVDLQTGYGKSVVFRFSLLCHSTLAGVRRTSLGLYTVLAPFL